ncbi:MAG: hypothetical protein ACRDM2_03865, partial [Gaiellaceae bacterium]
ADGLPVEGVDASLSGVATAPVNGVRYVTPPAGRKTVIAAVDVGSACSLLIFLLVGASGYRLRKETGSIGAIVLLAMATTAIVLVFFGIDTLRNAPETFIAIVCVTALAVILDLVWKRTRGPRQDPVPSPGS